MCTPLAKQHYLACGAVGAARSLADQLQAAGIDALLFETVVAPFLREAEAAAKTTVDAYVALHTPPLVTDEPVPAYTIAYVVEAAA